MNVLISDLPNHYKKCRRLADYYGKVIVLKNKKPDAVLLPIAEYERLSGALEKSGNYNMPSIVDLVKLLPAKGNRKVYTLAQLKQDLYLKDEIVNR